MKAEELPEPMRKMDKGQREVYVKEKEKERVESQKEDHRAVRREEEVHRRAAEEGAGGRGHPRPGDDRVGPPRGRDEGGVQLLSSSRRGRAQGRGAFRPLIPKIHSRRAVEGGSPTGRYPLTAPARWQDLPTFTAALTAAGFQTVFHTDCSRFNFQDERSGFQVRRQPPRGAMNFVLEKLRYRGLGLVADNALGAWWLPEFVDNRALAGIHDPIAYAERLAADLGARAARGPLLFAYHDTAAHFPGDPVYPYYRRFVPRSVPLERRLRMFFTPIANGAGRVPAGVTRAASEALYDELLSQADAQLGILLRSLKASGRYHGALIIVFSDHGESFHADVPRIEGATPVHGSRLGEEENRILLAVKPPGGRRVERVGALVRLLDIGPTVLEALGRSPLPGADGESLWPLLSGERAPPRRLYAETGFTHASPEVFDPAHAAAAPRTFDAYRVRVDGVVEMSDQAHDAVLREKDVGAFDGRSWVVRAPRKDGEVIERCEGPCDDPGLTGWLEALTRRRP